MHTILIAVALLLGSSALAFSESAALEIYPRMTMDGTIARRVFKDGRNRTVREVYYVAKSLNKHPENESDLVVKDIRLHHYDAQGRTDWMGVYSREWILQRSLESLYDVDGQLHVRQWREANGIVHYKELRAPGRAASHLHFDDTGTRLLRVQGPIPDGIDPATVKVVK